MMRSLLAPIAFAVLAGIAFGSTCITVPTPEESNVNRSQVGLFNGHVLLSTKQRPPVAGVDKTDTEKVAAILKNYTFPWKNNTIPFLLSTGLTQQQKDMIVTAMNYWESVSCVKFRPANLTNDYEFLQVLDSNLSRGCYSHLGMVQDGAFITTIQIDNGCDTFPVLADMLSHALGIYNTGGPITYKPSLATIAAVNDFHKCAAACPSKPVCLSGGSPSKDCARCVCPAEWAGDACDETSPGTRLIQVATTRDITLTLSGTYPNPEDKAVIVQAPPGKKLQAVVKSFGPNCFTTCSQAGVEITGAASIKTVCSVSAADVPIVSTGNSLTIRIFRNWIYPAQATVALNVV